MEKNISIVLKNDKKIYISVNAEEKHVIDEDRKITAETLYNLLDYSVGDKYKVESKTESGVEDGALNFFTELIMAIVDKVNKLENSEEILPNLV